MALDRVVTRPRRCLQALAVLLAVALAPLTVLAGGEGAAASSGPVAVPWSSSGPFEGAGGAAQTPEPGAGPAGTGPDGSAGAGGQAAGGRPVLPSSAPRVTPQVVRDVADGQAKVLVRIDGRDGGATEQALAGAGLSSPEVLGSTGTVAVTVDVGQLNSLAKVPGVHVEQDRVLHALVEDAEGDMGVTAVRQHLGGNAASGRGVGIAVVDTGVDPDHASMQGAVVAGANFSSGCGSGWGDAHGHGTHVASIAAGRTTPVGVAPGAGIIAVRVLDCQGSGSTSDIVQGLQWVMANRATYNIKVVNMSLGGDEGAGPPDVLQVAVNQLVAAGVTVVVAAGNSGPGPGSIGTPGVARHALTVGAVADAGRVRQMSGAAQPAYVPAWFSSRGPTLRGLHKPDVAAPGVDITAAKAGTAADQVALSGTSMASPFVAGVAALVRGAAPATTSAGAACEQSDTCPDGVVPGSLTDDVKDAIVSTARGYQGGDQDHTGAGIVDVGRAVGRASAGAPVRSWPTMAAAELAGTGASSADLAVTATRTEVVAAATCPYAGTMSYGGARTPLQAAVGFVLRGAVVGTTYHFALSSAGGCHVHAVGGTLGWTAVTASMPRTASTASSTATVRVSGTTPRDTTLTVRTSRVLAGPATVTVPAGSWGQDVAVPVGVDLEGVDAMGADGWVKFTARGTALEAVATTTVTDGRVRDRQRLAPHPDHGGYLMESSVPAGVSGDGQRVLALVRDDDSVPGSQGLGRVQLTDRRTATTTLVAAGEQDASDLSAASAAISGDGRSVAVSLADLSWRRPGRTVVVRDGTTTTTGLPDHCGELRLDWQGRTVWCLTNGGLYRWSAGAPAQQVMAGPWAYAVSVDGRTTAVSKGWAATGADRTQVLWQRDGGPWTSAATDSQGRALAQRGSTAGYSPKVWDVSPDGRKVAFTTTWVPQGRTSPVFPSGWVKDMVTGELTEVRAYDGGTPVSGQMPIPSLSGAGRMHFAGNTAVVLSTGDELTADDHNAGQDVYRYELATGEVTLLSRLDDGTIPSGGGNTGQSDPFVSQDGSVVELSSDTGKPSQQLLSGDIDYDSEAGVLAAPRPEGAAGTVTAVRTVLPAVVLPSRTPVTVGLAPPAGTVAAVVEVRVDRTTAPGYLRVSRSGRRGSTGSTAMSWDGAGDVRRTTAVVPVTPAGTTSWWSSSQATLNLTVVGWVGPTGTSPTVPVGGRVLDTRTGTGARVSPGASRTTSVVGAPGALAWASVTAVSPQGAGSLSVGGKQVMSWARGAYQEHTTVLVPLDAQGRATVTSTAATHVVVDVEGTAAGSLVVRDGARVLDTRNGTGGRTTEVGATVPWTVSTGGPVPPGATAAVVSITAVNPAGPGYLRAAAAGGPDTASVLVWGRSGGTATTTAVVPVDAAGRFVLRPSVPTHLVADVVGWVAPAG